MVSDKQVVDRIDEILEQKEWEYSFDENIYYIPAKDAEDMMKYIAEYANFLEGRM